MLLELLTVTSAAKDADANVKVANIAVMARKTLISPTSN
jgi:hypothetical protein